MYDSVAYPLNLDGSLRYTRPKTGIDIFPSPPMIRAIQGLMPQANLQAADILGMGHTSSGPWQGPASAGRPPSQQDLQDAFTMLQYPQNSGLTKQSNVACKK